MGKALIGIVLLLLPCPSFAQQKKADPASTPRPSSPFKWKGNCDESGGGLCADVYTHKNYEGQYSGHDEPAVAFYSQTPGSGNSMVVRLKIPSEPPTLPNQAGTGGTFNFQLHPAFWFSMILCDTQSAPEYTTNCVPDSDANIFDNPDPTAPDYINLHPGAAFMELQFYPPGWVFLPAEPTQHWVAAINIFSLSLDQAHTAPTFQNADCLSKVGGEPANFAFITRTGIPQAPPDPLSVSTPAGSFLAELADPTQALLMNPGDNVIVFIHDHPEGVRVIIFDETTKAFGWMTASASNGFAQIQYQPDPDPNNPSVTCSQAPYAFHPMYSTSSEHTRTTWTAHAMNISFADELGHFEYCNAVDQNGNCTAAGSNEPDGNLDLDDIFCASTLPPNSFPPFLSIAGCVFPDVDFNGLSYGNNWPGTLDPASDSLLHPTPILFSSPRFNVGLGLADYDRVAFESIAPGNEVSCDGVTGDGCVDPPPGAGFFPLFSTGALNGTCVWQFGGPNIAGATNTFGGTAAAEFGPLTTINYPQGVGLPGFPIYNLFRQVLSTNPCPGGAF